LTSETLVEALGARLQQREGPDIVFVLPARCPAWFEEVSMGRLRAASLARLRAADCHGRLRFYAPRVAPDTSVNVHAKLMIVDDELVRVGSSNLTNRSLGLDTECDLAIEARGRPDIAGAITRLRSDLLAEHLGASESEVSACERAEGSLIRAIEALRAGGLRTLVPIERCAEPGALALALSRPFDPAPRAARR
jgi:phospholipase D1/2